MRREAEIAEAQLLLTPADEHLNKRRIALSKLADDAEEAARQLREGRDKIFSRDSELHESCSGRTEGR